MMHSLASIVGELDKKHISSPVHWHIAYVQGGEPQSTGVDRPPLRRTCTFNQRGNVLYHTPQIWRPPEIGRLNLKLSLRGIEPLAPRANSKHLPAKPLRLCDDGSDKLYKSCHYTLQHGVYGVQQVARPKL